MRKILAVSLLGLVAASANAAGTYKLVTVKFYNLFVPLGAVLNGSIPVAGTAVVNGGGNVLATGISHSHTSPQNHYEYTDGVWSAVVGGTSVMHTETCVELSGTTGCTSPRGGLLGLWDSTNANGGAPSSVCVATTQFPSATLCDNVSIVEVEGVSLTITEQSEFAVLGSASGYIYTFLADADNDGIVDTSDNCTQVSNASQCDSDGDGFGNRCDGDFNQNNATNSQDYILFRQQLGQPSTPPTYNSRDINCNGAVNSQDYILFRGLLGSPPGPSGLVP